MLIEPAMLIEIEKLTKMLGSRAALDGVSLTIDPGQIVAMLGPNGAGKTTLLRCLAGVSQAAKGRLLYDGEVFRRDRIDLRKRFHFVPDFPFVYPDATVLQHLMMILRAYLPEDAAVEEKVIELLEEFEVLPLIDSPVGKLSRGQTYKVALTALMAVDPDVWILDEPFASGMDPHGIAAFRRRARDATRRGRTIIYSTQLLELAETFSDRVCIIAEGKVHSFDEMARLRSTTSAADGFILEELFDRLRESPE
jgi:ABC-2 type transport system ATP-binding protein